MQLMGMDVYLYAPKDDYKHRLYWRELYSPSEAGQWFKHLKPCVNMLSCIAYTSLYMCVRLMNAIMKVLHRLL